LQKYLINPIYIGREVYMDLEELLGGIWEKLNAAELSPAMYQYYD